MAKIQPFKAWRYDEKLSHLIEQLTSPLFDVVSQKQRNALYQNPYNSIHVSVPKGENPAHQAKETLENWIANGIITQEKTDCIYVYYQHFSLDGSEKTFCRKGFIAHIYAYDWNENVILRHENTIPDAVSDRLELLRATAFNVSPTHGLYTDASFVLEKYMDEAIENNTIYQTEDYQGVVDQLARIDDPQIIAHFVELMQDKIVILADGHHRYESSLAYRKEKAQQDPQYNQDAPYCYHLMYLTNTASDDLRILPTHRLLSGLEHFDEDDFIRCASEYFDQKEAQHPDDLIDIIRGKKWAFGIVLKNSAWIFKLKNSVFEQLNWSFPDVLKQMDLTVMHFFIIEKLLHIPGKVQRKSKHISFERNFSKVISAVSSGEIQLGVITNPVSVEQVKKVCLSGYTLPQKSTYFYPKAICGFLFSCIEPEKWQ